VKRQDYIKTVARELGVSPHAISMDYARAKAIGSSYSRTAIVSSPNTLERDSARTSDLLFIAAAILSKDPSQILKENFNRDSFEDSRAL